MQTMQPPASALQVLSRPAPRPVTDIERVRRLWADRRLDAAGLRALLKDAPLEVRRTVCREFRDIREFLGLEGGASVSTDGNRPQRHQPTLSDFALAAGALTQPGEVARMLGHLELAVVEGMNTKSNDPRFREEVQSALCMLVRDIPDVQEDKKDESCRFKTRIVHFVLDTMERLDGTRDRLGDTIQRLDQKHANSVAAALDAALRANDRKSGTPASSPVRSPNAGRARFRTLSAPQPAPQPAVAHVSRPARTNSEDTPYRDPSGKVLRNESRGELFYRSRAGLEFAIRGLEAAGRDPADPHRTLKRNKAKTLRWMMRRMEARMRTRPGYADERVEVRQAAGGTSLSDRLSVQVRKTRVSCTTRFINYAAKPPGAQVINAANIKLGGGLLEMHGRGWVQEEQQAAQIWDMMAYAGAEHGGTRTRTRKQEGTLAQDDNFTPVLFRNVRPLCSINKTVALLNNTNEPDRPDNIYTNPEFVPSMAFDPTDDAHPIDVISIAAPTLSREQRGALYEKDTVLDMVGSFAAGVGMLDRTRRLDSVEWGAGAFGHSSRMSMAVQMLACRFYGIDLRIYGVSNENDFYGAKAEVDKIWDDAMRRQAAGETVILRELAVKLWDRSTKPDLQWTTRPLN
jgi:hypothetical protein